MTDNERIAADLYRGYILKTDVAMKRDIAAALAAAEQRGAKKALAWVEERGELRGDPDVLLVEFIQAQTRKAPA